MKKLLYLPLIYQGGNEQWDLMEAFGKVYNLQYFDHLNEEEDANLVLSYLIKDWQPDIVHCQFSGRISPFTIKLLKKEFPKIIWTQWTGDARPYPLPDIVEWGRIVDATLLATGKGQKLTYQMMGVKNIHYWQHAVAPWQFLEPKPAAERKGIVMVANNYDQYDISGDRFDLAEHLTEEFDDFIVYGSGWPDNVRHADPIPWKDQGKLYNEAYLTVGTNGINTIPGYWSDRPYIAMAAGSPHLTHAVTGFDYPALTYKTIEEAIDQIHYALEFPEEIDAMSVKAQEQVRANDTWDNRVAQYQRIVDRL